MVLEITYTNPKFVCTQAKEDSANINFQKVLPEEHMSFNGDAWNYWVFDTYAELCNAFPYYVSAEFPCPNKIPPEEYM